MRPAIRPTPSGTPTPIPTLAPVERPPPPPPLSLLLLFELESLVVCAGFVAGLLLAVPVTPRVVVARVEEKKAVSVSGMPVPGKPVSNWRSTMLGGASIFARARSSLTAPAGACTISSGYPTATCRSLVSVGRSEQRMCLYLNTAMINSRAPAFVMRRRKHLGYSRLNEGDSSRPSRRRRSRSICTSSWLSLHILASNRIRP